MKSKQFLLLIFLWVFIFSCKKDDTINITYPSSYHKSGLKTTGDLRVFSSNGEIRDLSVTSRFNQKDSLYFFGVAYDIQHSSRTMYGIKLLDKHHATVNDSNFLQNCLLTQESGKLILTRYDISIGISYGDAFTQSPAYYIGQVKPEVYSENLISSTRGYYQFGYTSREKFVLSESDGQLVAPIILYLLHGREFVYSGYVNNILQKDFYKNLSAADTLTIKECQILYKK